MNNRQITAEEARRLNANRAGAAWSTGAHSEGNHKWWTNVPA